MGGEIIIGDIKATLSRPSHKASMTPRPDTLTPINQDKSHSHKGLSKYQD